MFRRADLPWLEKAVVTLVNIIVAKTLKLVPNMIIRVIHHHPHLIIIFVAKADPLMLISKFETDHNDDD